MFFCKEKCGSIFAMKKFILALVLVVMVGMDAGVVFADEPWDEQDAAKFCAESGGKVVGSKCVMDSEPTPSIECQNSGGHWVGGECVTQEKFCENQGQVYSSSTKQCESPNCADNEFWDSTNKVCKNIDEEFKKVCEEKELKYDPAIGGCYDPNAQQSTILPYTGLDETECEALFTYDASHLGKLKEILSTGKVASIDFLNLGVQVNINPLDVLGCGIKTGRVKMWMIPFFVKYLIQFAISIAGLVAVGAIIIGGYFYLFSGLDSDKERGKKAIMYGLLGFIVVLLAWTIVNAAIGLFTR